MAPCWGLDSIWFPSHGTAVSLSGINRAPPTPRTHHRAWYAVGAFAWAVCFFPGRQGPVLQLSTQRNVLLGEVLELIESFFFFFLTERKVRLRIGRELSEVTWGVGT